MDYKNLINLTKKIATFVISVLLVYAGFKISIFYIPFLIAFFIAQLVEPLIRFCMKKLKLRRKVSASIILAIILLIIMGLITWGFITLITEVTNFLSNINIYYEKISANTQTLISKFDLSKIQISNEIKTIISNSSEDLIETGSNWLKNFLTKLINVLTSIPTIGLYIIITLVALYFMCTDKIYMLDQIEHHLPRDWVRKLTKHIKALIKTLGCYLKAQIILVIISFIISLIGLTIFSIIGLNIKYPLMAALGVAVVDALPIFGSGTVMIPWAIISACNGDLRLGLCILGLWIIMTIARQVIEPKIVSKQIGIHPIFTLIAMYTGFKFLGFIGMFAGPIVLIILKNIFEVRIDKGIIKSIFD